MSQAAVSLRHVHKEFRRADYSIVALDDITIDIRQGDFFCLMGAVWLREVHATALGRRH